MATMTRQHFQLIADVIAELDIPDGTSSYNARVIVTQAFVNKLKHTNPNFRAGTFVEACEINLESVEGIN